MRGFVAISIGSELLHSQAHREHVFGKWVANNLDTIIALDTVLIVLGQPVCGIVGVWGLAGRVGSVDARYEVDQNQLAVRTSSIGHKPRGLSST